MKIKHLILLTLLTWLAVACAPNESATSSLVEDISQLVENTGPIADEIAHIAEEFANFQEGINNSQSSLEDFKAFASVHALGRTEDIPNPPSGKVAVRLGFQFLGDPAPGDGIQIFFASADVSTLWAMESLESGQSLPVGDLIEDGILFLEPGEKISVTIAYQNPTDDEVSFMVLPHQESPGQMAQFVWPTCLCMSYVYTAPAQGAWYRVIELTISPDTPPDSKVDVLWATITDPNVFPSN